MAAVIFKIQGFEVKFYFWEFLKPLINLKLVLKYFK